MEEYEASYDQICNPALGLVMFPGHWNTGAALEAGPPGPWPQEFLEVY